MISPLTTGSSTPTPVTPTTTPQSNYLTSILSGQNIVDRSKNGLLNGKMNLNPPSGTKISKSDNVIGRVNSVKETLLTRAEV